MAAANTNKMRWSCDAHGCFNEYHRLRFGDLEDALPGNIGITDVDALTECFGNGLLIEWKSPGEVLPKGQSIAYERLTRGRLLTVFFITGSTKETAPKTMAQIVDGKLYGPIECDRSRLKTAITRWADWSRANARFNGSR